MKVLRMVLPLAGLILFLLAAQRLLEPKYMEGVYDGALIGEYYDEPKNHQVIFVGDCEVYENFSPVELWRSEGYTSYIRGGAQQLVWQSYYLLEDTLRYETPEVAVFNVLSMKFSEPQSEAYNRLNIDGMRLSASKLGAARASMTEGENLLSYVFPLLRYHERWLQLTAEDFRWFLTRDRVGHNGFLMRSEIKAVDMIPKPELLADYTFAPLCYEYLDKMTALCAEKGIRLILIKAPSLYPAWHDDWETQIERYAEENQLPYINFLEHIDEIGLDFSVDTYDAGLHLNITGAEKLTRYFGAMLREQYGLGSRRDDADTAALWAEKCEIYDRAHALQLAEIEQHGKVLTFTH